LSAIPRTHVCFGHSASGTLRHALLSGGHDEPVLNFWGCYVAGPLKQHVSPCRSTWLAEHYYGVGEDDDFKMEHAADEQEFREALASCEGELVAWTSRRCAAEYCDFLEFVSAARNKRRLSIADLSEARSKSGMLCLSVGTCWPEVLASHFDSIRPLSNEEREQLLSYWQRLSEENADLRMLAEGNLVSTALDRYDAEILRKISNYWTIAARVVGNAMGWIDMADEQLQGYGDLFWFKRLRTLAVGGVIDWRGPPHGNMREVSVRRMK